MNSNDSAEPKIYDLDAPARPPAHLLLLDDEGDFTTMLTSVLEAHGYLVTVAGNAADGVKLLMHRDFSGIICDLMMPGLPGDMFYLAVERMKPHLCRRFIFITGYPEDPKFKSFLTERGVPALFKPFKTAELLALLERAVDISGLDP